MFCFWVLFCVLYLATGLQMMTAKIAGGEAHRLQTDAASPVCAVLRHCLQLHRIASQRIKLHRDAGGGPGYSSRLWEIQARDARPYLCNPNTGSVVRIRTSAAHVRAAAPASLPPPSPPTVDFSRLRGGSYLTSWVEGLK